MNNDYVISDLMETVERIAGIRPDPPKQSVEEIMQVVDQLTCLSYMHQRDMFPETSPERWAAIYDDWQNYEVLYAELVAYRMRKAEAPNAEIDTWYVDRGANA